VPLRQVFTGDASQLQRELEKTQQQYARLESQLQRLTRESQESGRAAEQAGRDGGGGIDELTNKVGGAIAGYLSLEAAIQATNRALEDQRRISREALEEQLTVSDTQAEVRRALGDVGDAQFRRVLSQIQGIQTETGIADVRQLNLATAAALSASGGDIQRALATTAAAGRAGRGSPEAMQAISSGALAVANLVPGVTPEQAISFMQQGFGQAFISDIGVMARPSVEAMGAVMPTVASQDSQESARQTMALFAAMTRMRGDPTGRETGSILAVTMSRAREFFGGDVPGMTDAEQRRMREQLGEDPGTLFGRLQQLRESPESVRQQFFRMFGAATFRPFVEEFIQGQGLPMAQAAAGQIGFDVGAFERLATSLETATPELQAAMTEARGAGGFQQDVLLSRRLAMREEAARIRERAFEQIQPGLAERVSEYMWWPVNWLVEGAGNLIGRDPVEASIRGELAAMERMKANVRPLAGEATAVQREQLAIIKDATDRLTQMLQQLSATAAQAQPNRHHE